MDFEIDVSGEDILDKDYVICVANKENLIKGFKMSSSLVKTLNSKFGQGIYNRYNKSLKGKSNFKIRLYSIIIYLIFKSIKVKEPFNLILCRDFDGKENDIKSNLNYFLKELLGLKIKNIRFTRLEQDSNAHQYAYLMKKDIEKYLKK